MTYACPTFLMPSRHHRRNVALVPLATMLLSGAVAGCGADDSGGEASDDAPQVVASIYPLAFAAQRVLGDEGTVDLLTSPGVEPHDVELTVDQTGRLAEADLVVSLRDFAPAVDEALDQNPPEAVVDAADVISLRSAEGEHDHHAEGAHEEEHVGEHTDGDHPDGEHAEGDHADEEHGEEAEHDHGGTDPHFWLDPTLLSAVAVGIEEELSSADPDRAETYGANLAELQQELADLDDEYTTALAACRLDTIVVSHDAFSYLERYGLHFEPVAGLSPDSEPSLKHLTEIHDVVEEHDITTVFTERLASPKVTETLADDLGISTDVLDPIEGLTDETADEDYLSLMRANLTALTRANSCS